MISKVVQKILKVEYRILSNYNISKGITKKVLKQKLHQLKNFKRRG